MTAGKPAPFSATDVRRAFLEYFAERGHTIVPSSSLIPGNDPTLLFTNAGMVQFKDVFLGKDRRDYPRATSSQRCVRAGGKHNDLENVGYTARHHTFFEMLGNFSFGDYFKREAIGYAWEFVTRTLGLDPARLWITVYRDDDEAAELWAGVAGVRAERIVRLGEKSNFWSMGETGPCGPCTEIFYDHGPQIPGGPPGSPEEDGDRFVEIWNLVFMQYDRAADGTLTPLPKPSVDTGAGLERLAAVMQGVHSNYDIDLFQILIRRAAELLGTADLSQPALRVIADHIRAAAFLVLDGVLPSNEGRGYVLRRIMRRAMRHGHPFGAAPTFFHQMLPALVASMGEAYPVLVAREAQIDSVLRIEGERFAETLNNGMTLLEEAIGRLDGRRMLDGETIFRLYDTFGFPVDLTADVARERGLELDLPGFEAAMAAQRELSKSASRFGVDLQAGATLEARTAFEGYEALEGSGRVVAILKAGAQAAALGAGEEGEVVLDATPFYAESGGQVGDAGELSGPGIRFVVSDTIRRGGAYAHRGRLIEGTLCDGEAVVARVDAARRHAIARNHSATHLLHAALRRVLGTHVEQRGSLVAPDRLRFDFAHFQPISLEEILAIERLVNAEIRGNAAGETRLMDYDAAVAAGAMALFGEKYESRVRVLRFGDFSMELCGGTHVARTGDIGFFKIVSESGVASGVRRIEAVTGEGAVAWVERSEALLKEVAGFVRGNREDLADKVRESQERVRALEKELRALKDKLASGQGQDLAAGALDVAGVKVVATRVEGADAGALRNAVDALKSRLKSAVIVLASVEGGAKVVLVAGVTDDLVARVKAGELVAAIAARVGGRGGGRADFAQAGGSDPAALPAALASVAGLVQAKLGA
jgi:alanyl-tRNA synthetase